MKIALIGYGNIAIKHLEVFRALGCEIVASCNRSDDSNQKARKEGRIPKTFSNYIEMVETESPDAILNCVSFGQLYQTTAELIPYGIPILMEKPPGLSYKDLQDLIRLQNSFNTPVQVGLNRRHYSVFHRAIEDAGGMGQIRSIHIEWSEAPTKMRDKYGYTHSQVKQYIYANSLHGLDMLTFFGGEPIQPQILTQDNGDYLRWRMHLSGQAANGRLLSFYSSWDNAVPWRMVMESKDARYVFAPLESCKKIDAGYRTIEIEPEQIDQQFKAGFFQQAQFFLDVATNRSKSHAHDLNASVPGMRLAESLTHAFSVNEQIKLEQ